MNNLMVSIIEQLWNIDSGQSLLSNMNFDKEKLIKIDPMYIDMAVTNIGLSFWKVFSDNMARFIQFLNLLIDPYSIFTRIKQFAENVKPETSF